MARKDFLKSMSSNKLLGLGDFYNGYAPAREISLGTYLVFESDAINVDIDALVGEIDVFANYKSNDLDIDGTTTYVGQQKVTTGEWLIQKIDDATGDLTITWANISNNALVTTYTDAWTDRATLTYNLIGDLTI